MIEKSKARSQSVVLIAEDDQSMRLMVRHNLERHGYEAVEAVDGGQALSLYGKVKPNAVLLDAVMPTVDGFEVCSRLRSMPGADRIPILLVTGLNDPESVNKAFEAGATDYLTKPIHWGVLIQRLGHLLRAARAETKLAAAEAHMRSVVHHAQDGIITFNAKGSIESFNPAAERLFRYQTESVIGKPIRILFDRSSPSLDLRSITRQELQGKCSDGFLFPIELTLSGFEVEGEAFHTIILRDITKQKQIEEELAKARDHALESARLKSEFISNMSHEMRTPMNGIIGMTELALDTALSAEQRDYLSAVKYSADSMLAVIDDVLDFSELETGKLELSPIGFKLRDSLGETVRIVEFRARQKGLELHCHVAADVPEELIGDPGRLRQVLLNLLGNAVKFTDQGEVVLEVSLDTSRDSENKPRLDPWDGGATDRTASMAAERCRLHFSIRDTGIGVPAEKQDLIFGAFTQVDGSVTRLYGGTGLGLAISSQLVEMMGGRIWVESFSGDEGGLAPEQSPSVLKFGSTFHFTACFEVVDGRQGRKRDGMPKIPVGMRVLIVDDNAIDRRILEDLLASAQLQPIGADNSTVALSLMEEARHQGNPIELAILDVQMPGMDGFALADEIQRRSTIADARVILLTSAGQRGDCDRCRELGISAYLPKPVHRQELLEAIRIVVNDPSPREDGPGPVTRHTIREGGLQLALWGPE